MAKKRFTDVDKWRDPWFMDLPPHVKLLWNYLCDACDNAGVWCRNTKLAELQIGTAIDWDAALASLGDRIRVFDGGRKWHIVRFVEFQCGATLNPKSKPHAFILALLDRHGLGHGVGDGVCNTPKERERERETEREEDSNARATPPTTPLPLSQTKPGVMELRAIPGLKLTQDSMPAWLALVDQVGLSVIEAARDELVLAGKDCWVSDVSTVALRLHQRRRQSAQSREVTQSVEADERERRLRVEAARIADHEEAERFMAELVESGHLPECPANLLADLRTGMANRDRGSLIGGRHGPLFKIQAWFQAIKSQTPTEGTV